jgi:hypothetical protein
MVKRAKILLIFTFAFVMLSGLFYHSGLNSHCLFCIWGAGYLKFVKPFNFNFPLFFYLLIFIFLTDPARSGSAFKKGFLTRAPPLSV